MDWPALVAALCSGIAAIIAALALIKTTSTHELVNSKMLELLKLTASSARAEGRAEEMQLQRDETLARRDRELLTAASKLNGYAEGLKAQSDKDAVTKASDENTR